MSDQPNHRPLQFAGVVLLLLLSHYAVYRIGKRQTQPHAPTESAQGANHSTDLRERGLHHTRTARLRFATANDDPSPQRAQTGDFKARWGLRDTRWRLFGGSWEITTGASEALGLSRHERSLVQAAIDRLKEDAGRAVANRAELNTHASDVERGITVYRIPAAPDRGESLLNDFEDRLIEGIGEAKAKQLRESFDPRGEFGGFGRFDVLVEFDDMQPDGAPPQVAWEYRDPDTGELRSRGEMNEDAFRGRYGEIFDVKTGTNEEAGQGKDANTANAPE